MEAVTQLLISKIDAVQALAEGLCGPLAYSINPSDLSYLTFSQEDNTLTVMTLDSSLSTEASGPQEVTVKVSLTDYPLVTEAS